MPDPMTPRPPPARRLLVLACSARKRPDAGVRPAIDRYDGPAFRVLRRFLANAPDPPAVLILSARYGLIPGHAELPAYDRVLTPAAADALRPAVLRDLADVLAETWYAELALLLGRTYRRAVAGYDAVVPAGTVVTVFAGGQGVQLRNLKAWLHRLTPG